MKKVNQFYKSAAWLKCREVVLKRDNYLCQRCIKRKKITPATVVHHIEHLEDAPEKALDEDNLESVCHPCHNLLHPEKGFGVNLEKQIVAVLGYPASGKTTWVKENMSEYDIVLDLDRLITAMTYKNGHDRTGNAFYAVKVADDMIKNTMENILLKGYNFDKLYLIRSRLTDDEFDNLRAARAKFYWMDTSKEVCERRLIEQGREDVIQAIEKCEMFQEKYRRRLRMIAPLH